MDNINSSSDEPNVLSYHGNPKSSKNFIKSTIVIFCKKYNVNQTNRPFHPMAVICHRFLIDTLIRFKYVILERRHLFPDEFWNLPITGFSKKDQSSNQILPRLKQHMDKPY